MSGFDVEDEQDPQAPSFEKEIQAPRSVPYHLCLILQECASKNGQRKTKENFLSSLLMFRPKREIRERVFLIGVFVLNLCQKGL